MKEMSNKNSFNAMVMNTIQVPQPDYKIIYSKIILLTSLIALITIFLIKVIQVVSWKP